MSHICDPDFSTIVPAALGFFVLEPIFGDNEFPIGAIRQPIVAWGIDASVFCAHPITINAAHYRTSPYILQPDGTVECAFVDSYQNEDDWLAQLQAL
ncbi:MAG TPA: hypothetical protein VNW52_08145, partial [Burkholderiaceae bacterium]|nr:hypothetical protein [Burkholderiaceae bacterium]